MNKKICSLYVLKNASVWSSTQEPQKIDLLIKDGRVLQMKSEIEKVGTVIDLGGKALLPSGVDVQAHLRVPGQPQKETAATGLLAALRGGYAAVLTMPNTEPTIDAVEVLERGKAEVREFEESYGISVLWSAAITKNLNSNELTDFASLARHGVVAFTNDGLGVLEDEVMALAFAKLQGLNIPLLQHAEFLGHGGVLAAGPVQQSLGVKPYPEEPEWQMVERDLRLLRNYPQARYHVLHVSCAKTVQLVKAAKAEGLRVTAEVSPHHLYFNTETMDKHNLSFKMNPPIRSPNDQEALWRGLAEGVIDFVATDHAPHEILKKQGSFEQASFGTLGLETTLRVLIGAWQSGKISSQRLVQVFARNPAVFLRLKNGLGELKLGSEFHGVLVDLQAVPLPFTEQDISSLSKNSCFVGQRLPGKICGAFHAEQIFEFN
jgi:dihydroorotase